MCICRCSDGSNKTLCTWRDLTETEPDLPLSVWVNPEEVCVSSGLPQGQGLWVQQTWVWHKPSWRRLPLTPPQSHQNCHRNGETDSWRAKTKPVHSRTQEKGAVTPQETDPDLPGVSRSSGGGMGQWWPIAGGTEWGNACTGLFEGGHHYLHYLHHSLVSGQQQGGNTALPINRKLD